MHDLSKASITFGTVMAVGIETILHAAEAHTTPQCLSTLAFGYAMGATSFGYGAGLVEETLQKVVRSVKFSGEYLAYAKAALGNTAVPLAIYAGLQTAAVQQFLS